MTCSCGGNYVSIDRIEYSGIRNQWDTVRIKPGYASKRCNRCCRVLHQKLRVSRSATTEVKHYRSVYVIGGKDGSPYAIYSDKAAALARVKTLIESTESDAWAFTPDSDPESYISDYPLID